MIKNILLGLLISTQCFAGLPPTTIKGQTDSTAKVKTSFQVPNSQATDLGGGTSLIETGNGNIVPDPGFEAATSGWTASGGATAAANSTAKGTGAKGYDWDSNAAAQTLTSTSVTIPNGYKGKNGVLSCNIKTVSGTSTHTIGLWDGTTLSSTQTITNSTTSFIETKINFVFPSSGTAAIRLTSIAANEPEIYIDDCKISLADNIFEAPLVTGWTNFTPTGSWVTNTTYSGKYRRVGEMMEIQYYLLLSGAPTAANLTLNLPSGFTIDSTKILTNTATNSVGLGTGIARDDGTNSYTTHASYIPSNTSIGVLTTGSPVGVLNNATPFTFGNLDSVLINASVPILGWSAVSAVAADQTDYDWTAYTPTFTGFGTVSTSNFFHKRIGDTMYVRGKFTSGTTTSVEARVSLPNSLTTASSTLIPGLTMAGSYVRGGQSSSTTAHGGSVLMNSSLGYVTFDRSETYGSGAIQTQTNVSNASTDFSSVGDIISMNFSVPISTFVGNQRAPTLIGSVTSNASNAKRIEVASVNCSASSTGDDFLSSPTNMSSGICTFTISAGYSSSPKCFIQRVENTVTGNADWQVKATSATSLTTVCVAGGSACSGGGNIDVMCIGNR